MGWIDTVCAETIYQSQAPLNEVPILLETRFKTSTVGRSRCPTTIPDYPNGYSSAFRPLLPSKSRSAPRVDHWRGRPQSASHGIQSSEKGAPSHHVAGINGAASVLPALPETNTLITDIGHNSDWYPTKLESLGIEARISERGDRNARSPRRHANCVQSGLSPNGFTIFGRRLRRNQVPPCAFPNNCLNGRLQHDPLVAKELAQQFA